jgi:cytochrome c peroxidase
LLRKETLSFAASQIFTIKIKGESVMTILRHRPRGALRITCIVALAVALGVASDSGHAQSPLEATVGPRAGLTLAPDSTGVIGTYNVAGATDTSNPFFQSLGTNGRSCATCHLLREALSFTPQHARQLYEESDGADPLFASTDGANCPNSARNNRSAHSLILGSGLIRIGLAIPDDAEYSVSLVKDPTGCGLQVDPGTSLLTASVYRRPLPAANLSFLSALMFDGRETVGPLTTPSTFATNLRADLAHQAMDATTGHAQAAAPPSDVLVAAIVDFELGLFTGQYADRGAGRLDRGGAAGGPINLATEPYYPGINDSLGADPLGLPFTPASMTVYQAWQTVQADMDDHALQARADIAAGEKLFNEQALTITNVRGINDNPALGRPKSVAGHCTTCHDAPNIGGHSLPLPLDIGTGHSADPSFEPDPLVRAAVSQLSGPDLPVFLISGCPNPFDAAQPVSFYTTDPGKALVTGKCADLNRVKGPILRGLAARAPYFHNGAAASLMEVVNFYDHRFQMRLTARQKRELVAFLNSL